MTILTMAHTSANYSDTVAKNFNADDAKQKQEAVLHLAAKISTWFVRKDGKFFDVENLNVRLSKDDVERTCVNRYVEEIGRVKAGHIWL